MNEIQVLLNQNILELYSVNLIKTSLNNSILPLHCAVDNK